MLLELLWLVVRTAKVLYTQIRAMITRIATAFPNTRREESPVPVLNQRASYLRVYICVYVWWSEELGHKEHVDALLPRLERLVT